MCWWPTKPISSSSAYSIALRSKIVFLEVLWKYSVWTSLRITIGSGASNAKLIHHEHSTNKGCKGTNSRNFTGKSAESSSKCEGLCQHGGTQSKHSHRSQRQRLCNNANNGGEEDCQQSPCLSGDTFKGPLLFIYCTPIRGWRFSVRGHDRSQTLHKKR